jgi:hypothetical protein
MSDAVTATVIGFLANATAMPVASRIALVDAAARHRQEGIVGDLGQHEAVEASVLGRRRCRRYSIEAGGHDRVDLHRPCSRNAPERCSAATVFSS